MNAGAPSYASELAGVVRFGHAWHVFVDGEIRPDPLPDRLAAIDLLREIAQADAARQQTARVPG